MEIGAASSWPTAQDPLPARPSRRYGQQLLDALEARTDPATAQELFAQLRATGQRAGLATVYRALHALEQHGSVHAIRRSDEIAYRRCGTPAHEHLVCVHCGAVEEVPRSDFARWFSRVAPQGYRLPEASAQIAVICDRCTEA